MERVTPWNDAAVAELGLTSVRYQTFIWRRPLKGGDDYLGYLRVGQRVALKSEDKVEGQGCPKGFYRVEPLGFVCDDDTVTRQQSTPFLRANGLTSPRDTPFPYDWAISNGAPMYARLPTVDEQRRKENRYGKVGVWHPLPKFSRGHEHLATLEPIAAADPMPAFLEGGMGPRGPVLSVVRKGVPHGTLFAYTRAFDHGGRTFLLSADLTVVPADRVRQFRRSTFHGVELDAQTSLPRAWFRVRPRPVFRREGNAFVATERTFALRSHVGLTGTEVEHDGRRFLETTTGDWAAASDATVVRARDDYPYGVRRGDKWMLVSLMDGTLVAYEDLTPVFTTLISPGRGGVPIKGRDPVADATTPTGSFKVTFKDRAATMASEFGQGRKFWVADVPFTQYFHPPFALHGAYWHEKFGEPMSAGCINASPLDAAWLFGWTEPVVPSGWQGIIANADEKVSATWIVVTR